jgi:hypothetical protein
MHVSFDESNTSKEDIVVCDDDDDILEIPSEEVAKDINEHQLEHQQEVSQQETNQSDLPKEWNFHQSIKILQRTSQKV